MREHHRYDARKNIVVTEKRFLLRNMKKAVVIRMPLEFVVRLSISSIDRDRHSRSKGHFEIVLTRILDADVL